ncbi:MAG: xanthine dehydrogenase family protein molybdopterin-binding subunit [Acidobacteria bacterium]|nr:MAG: xanthine dehydrogenase family protein molybdopterin-binding subunit [Acidobacteriota bacterium]REK03156.1 MAG: xanthine dehydrogenase family protein molybdopterin-binding subunit [Acidobacteriota bacterium]REK15391.1 MAG: xanthine dehydrogenase family protein molybdopterin-binding subunit [Acidobacteriota bacterium]REK42110.1 MAG: xanthine dehydrogenase family protein molybdopterin-binding subunit [Acidobacteriota bacterium]
MRYIGKEMSRVDGVAKVTGKARYASEYKVNNPAYGYIVQSEIAKGTIKSIDVSKAEKLPGVLKILTHRNSLKVEEQSRQFRALQNDKIVFCGQPIALVIADTFEQARYAANLVSVEYDREQSATDFDNLGRTQTRSSPARGKPAEEFEAAPVKIEAEYSIPIEHHNPMEPHAATAFWEGDKLTIFDKSQGVYGVRGHLARSFGIAAENVNVISLFVGGAFGASLNVNYYPFITALAAKEVGRPVKVNYTRRQMFTGHGYRPYTAQKVSIGAGSDGKLRSIIHEAATNTSSYEDFTEGTTRFGRTLYQCPNYDSPYYLLKSDLPTPTWMRAPGAVSGAFAIESAIDELAYKLDIDPVELRLINYAEKDPDSGKPFSSKELKTCFTRGAKKFGWERRKMEPRSMRDGNWLVGWGTATGTWGAFQAPAGVNIRLNNDGTVLVGSGTTDIGPGTYTVITIIAAEVLGIAPEKITFKLGDTDLPRAPSQGGSLTTASVGSAVYGAAGEVRKKLLSFVDKKDGSPLFGAKFEETELADGNLRLKNDPSKGIRIVDVLKEAQMAYVEVDYQSSPSPERQNYTTMAHGAQFVEVKVEERLGIVKVTKVVEATACGRIINPLTSHSQEMGGVVWGIGMALHEATEIDHRYGKMMTTNLADYHVPVNADVHFIETEFVEEKDEIVNELGIKGMGELCLVGIPAAIANAVFHATGKRVRDLPITPDKLL